MNDRPPGRRKATGRGPVSDWHLWSEVKKTVSPLPGRARSRPVDAKGLEEAVNSPPPAETPPPPEPARRQTLRPTGPLAPSYRPLYDFVRPRPPLPDLEPNLKHRVARGRLPIDATLDLHGMTQEAAHLALLRFLPARAARGDRTILVITGKGLKKTGYLQIEERGILRHAVPRWLSEPPLRDIVSGVDTAHVGHGGQGALYVRLKARGTK